MSKAILLSIKPQYVAKILNGEKTIEIRKRPIPVGTKVYIYCTKSNSKKLLQMKGNRYVICNEVKWWEEENPNDIYEKLNGKVVASFVVSKCEKIINYEQPLIEGIDLLCEESCLELFEIKKYANNKPLFAWHISQLKIFDKPKELNEFYKPCNIKSDCSSCRYLPCSKESWRLTKAPQSYCYVEQVD